MRGVLSPLVAASWLVQAAALDRLTIVNACPREPIWIAHLANVGVGPGAQNVKIPPMGSHAFTEAETDGLGGARYWPKMGCDEQGNHCKLGGSGGPTQSCVVGGGDYSRCAPPVDTKFEATWGRAGQPCNAAVPSEMGGCDSVDMSLVDGWTLPFKLEITSGTCTGQGEATVSQIDCSGMTLDRCPMKEDLGHGPTVSMVAISPHSGKPAGCYGPCLKLIDDKWNNTMARGRKREDPSVVPYCCTFPPMTSEMCNAGPIGKTQYVRAVHQLCPGVYAFAYDDGMGLMRCTYGQYRLSFFCPDGGQASPPQPPAAPAAGAAPPQPPAAQPPAPVQRFALWARSAGAEDTRSSLVAAWALLPVAAAALGAAAWQSRRRCRAPPADSTPVLGEDSEFEAEESAGRVSPL
mmetsp:Transcript_48844/g.145987  ORF Transcript_48844/g.145987 Transcript_48844/m.145987 type:complete len:406 (-) Transcript_48844:51-1268(-)